MATIAGLVLNCANSALYMANYNLVVGTRSCSCNPIPRGTPSGSPTWVLRSLEMIVARSDFCWSSGLDIYAQSLLPQSY